MDYGTFRGLVHPAVDGHHDRHHRSGLQQAPQVPPSTRLPNSGSLSRRRSKPAVLITRTQERSNNEHFQF